MLAPFFSYILSAMVAQDSADGCFVLPVSVRLLRGMKMQNLYRGLAMQNTCKLCGKPFEARAHNTSVCDSCRMRTCEICGKEFELEYPFTKRTCSPKCYGELKKRRGDGRGKGPIKCTIERTCEICGKTFIAKSSRRKRCYDDHYHDCPVCGKSVLTKDLAHLNECCSKECSRKLAVSTTKGRFDEWPADSEEACAKRLKTIRDAYGVDNVFQSEEIKAKSKSTMLAKYDVENSSQLDSVLEKRKKTSMDRYGVPHPSKSEELKVKHLKALREKYGDPELRSTLQLDFVKGKIKATNLSRYGVENPMQVHDVWAKQSSTKSKYFASDGTKLDSQCRTAPTGVFFSHSLQDYCTT